MTPTTDNVFGDETDWSKTCRACGGKRVMVRPKWPNTPERNVCPTCMLELVEGLFSYDAFGIKQAEQAKEE